MVVLMNSYTYINPNNHQIWYSNVIKYVIKAKKIPKIDQIFKLEYVYS